MRRRPDVVFLAWSRTSGRSQEIAAALGGDPVCVFPRRLTARRLFAPRYLYSAAVSVRELLRRRPRSIIATNPPVFPGLLAWLYAGLTRTPFVLDSHPTSFGAKDHRVSQRLLGLHRWLARRATAVMVTTSQWVDVLHSWGAVGIVVHEAPPLWSVSPLDGPAGRRALFVGVFGSDEPIECVFRAAALRPDLEVHVTGDLRRCPPGLLRDSPANVRLVGYLGVDDYVSAVAAADIVVALTTEPTSIVRAGYEAVYARRPLIISDWPEGRKTFPFAVATANDPAALAAAFDQALTAENRDADRLEAARQTQLKRWTEQCAHLRGALGIDHAGKLDKPSDTIAVLS
jgi:hypothetical protein